MHFIRLLRLLDIIVVLEWGKTSKLLLPKNIVKQRFLNYKYMKKRQKHPCSSLEKCRIIAQKVSGSCSKKIEFLLKKFQLLD